MSKNFLLILCVLITTRAFSQKIRFSDTTNTWSVYETTCGPGFLEYFSNTHYYSGTVTHGGKNYNVLHISLSDSAYIREDTVLNKVYIIPNNILWPTVAAIDTTEHLLYDYNWQLGDIVSDNIPGLINSYAWVSSIDSVQINSIWHKRWSFSGCDTFYMSLTNYDTMVHYSVIEGIGCVNSFYYPLFTVYISSGVCTYIGSSSAEVLCFANHGTKPAITPAVVTYGVESNHSLDNTTSCAITAVKNTTRPVTPVSVFPDPVTDETKLALPGDIQKGMLIVMNAMGQVIARLEVHDTREILFGNRIIDTGFYTYCFIDETSGKTWTGKFLK